MRRIHYNSPVILTYFFLSLGALLMGVLTRGYSTAALFSVYRAPLTPLFFFRLFGHVLGHSSYAHFAGNMVLLLVVNTVTKKLSGSGLW